MKLLEHEGKMLFRQVGISVPDSICASSLNEVRNAIEKIGVPVVVKAQVLSGGRGKRGGILIADTFPEAVDKAKMLFEKGLTGEKVSAVLIEEAVSLNREFYMAITIDAEAGKPVLMVSSKGGVEIESVPEANIATSLIDISTGLQDFELRAAIKNWDMEESQIKEIINVGLRLYKVFRQYDADLVEINPLGLTNSGNIMALDAKVIINDNSLFRQQGFEKIRERFDNELEYRASQHNLNYVKLNGNIGLLCTGAGLTLATLDLINDNDGSAANFLESGGANYTNTFHGLELVLSDPEVKVLMINTFGLVSRADVICRGLADAIKGLKPEVPIVASIRGTGEEEGRRIFREELGIEPYDSMEKAIKAAIKLVR
jgi:succinyl-CoA synthetase beta subunit